MSQQNAIDDYLKNLGTPTEASSEFTVNTASALRKMSQSQLPDPGLWAVKVVQGAVALDCFGVEFVCGRDRLVCRVYGPPIPSGHEMLKNMLKVNSSGDKGHHHWLVALRSLYGDASDGWGWRSICGETAEIVRFDGDEPVVERAEQEPSEVEVFEIQVPTKRTKLGSAITGAAEYALLSKHCSLATIPVTFDQRLISQQHTNVLVRGKYAAQWMEKATNEEPSFPLMITSPQKHSPPIIAEKRLSDQQGVHRCSLLVSVCPAKRKPAFEIYWLRDGALLGPYQVLDGERELDIVVVFPGEKVETDLSEWAVRDSDAHFSPTLILNSLNDIGIALAPHVEKSVDLDTADRKSWLSYLGKVGEIIGEAILVFVPLTKKVGLPAEFVESVIELGRRTDLRLMK